MSECSTTIFRVGDEQPIRFAASELRAHLRRSTRQGVRILARGEYSPAEKGIWIGTFARLGEGHGDATQDAIRIKTDRSGGVVAGSNPRSVLLGAYRFLTELGFRWVRPGRDGQRTPELQYPIARRLDIRERASYDHRCICIEGASGLQHVLDMIDWMPKLGFNSYFVQFRTPYHFFDRWYSHDLNPRMKKEPFGQKDAEAYTRRIWAECRKRGMLIQMVGHGWTCDPLGIPGRGWYEDKRPVPQSVRRHLAKIDGRREFCAGIPLNTNLCYGNPATRRVMAGAVADYAAAHPNIDAIHLWLADGCNNHCECPRCRDHRPADLYVKLLNETDAVLTRRDLSAKIVFLLYNDLLWPPKVERFRNPDRFILMFAPVTRTYSRSLAETADCRAGLPRFSLNKLQLPREIGRNLASYRGWRRRFKGDAFLFDYYLMWDHFKDPGHYALAQVLHADIRALGDLGLQGLNSVQVQRCFMPSGLLMTVMGRTLWNRNLSFDEIANDHYRSAFGADWRKVKRYTQRLSDLFDPPHLRNERDEKGREETLRKLAELPTMIRRFLPVIETNLHQQDRCQARSWFYLKEHAEICLAMAKAVEAMARRDEAACDQYADRVIALARGKERRIHRVFDVRTFVWSWQDKNSPHSIRQL